jgi:hypothetical protein
VLIGAATSDARSDKGASRAASQKSPAPPASPATTTLPSIPIPAAPAVAPHAGDAESETKDRQQSAPVTITGCLERDADTFRLRDTAGDNAPKARNWKSGFLKKGPAAIHVLDNGNRMKLPTHVGQRVSVTGTLVDREMQVRSLQRVAASCGAKS